MAPSDEQQPGEVVRYRVERGVATITLDSPANRNALSSALIDQLQGRLAEAGADSGVRAVRLSHLSPTFCSGADLREALRLGTRETSLRLLTLLRTMVDLAKPVVGCIDGHARGGGLGLVAACDIVVAGPGSSFAFTEVRLGLAPAIISLVTSARISSRAAARYYLTGEAFGPVEAARIGLVTDAADDAAPACEALLDALRLGSPQGLAESKRLTSAGLVAAMDAGGTRLAELSARLFGSAEAREGMAAFAERRRPIWAEQPPA